MGRLHGAEATLVLATSSLVVPTILRNGSVYGACSTRSRDGQRLLLPTVESVGHFCQGFAAMSAILFGRPLGVTCAGIVGLVIYPVYNFLKRVRKGHGHGLGLNNTSYATNAVDFLLGVWLAAAVAWAVRPRAFPEPGVLQRKLILSLAAGFAGASTFTVLLGAPTRTTAQCGAQPRT